MQKIPWLVLSFLVLLWLQFYYVLHPNWQGHSYYDFGWFHAPIVGYFSIIRWRECNSSRPVGDSPWWPWILVALLVLGLFPLRILEQVDPFWRLPLWLHAFLVLSITHLTIFLISGFRTSRWLLPATLLILLAVPAPSFLENALVHSLTDWVVAFTKAVLPITGYPAEQVGQSFLINGEPVDVAEGCSGIRSFQSCIAVAFVLGELQRLPVVRLLVLVFAALGVAVLANTVRVFSLIEIAHQEGTAAMNAAHDEIGLGAALATYLVIGILSWLLDFRKPAPKARVTRKTSPSKPAPHLSPR